MNSRGAGAAGEDMGMRDCRRLITGGDPIA
jgi:hypothetical protein